MSKSNEKVREFRVKLYAFEVRGPSIKHTSASTGPRPLLLFVVYRESKTIVTQYLFGVPEFV